MRKIWLMTSVTYRRRVRSGMFLILTFGLPVLMVVAGAVPILIESGRGDLLPVGYVDETGRLADMSQVSTPSGTLTLSRYPDQGGARAAVDAGQIAGYLLIPRGYFEGEQPIFYGDQPPSASMQEALTSFMQHAILPDQPSWVYDRLDDPTIVTHIDVTTGVEVREGVGMVIHFGFPAVLALGFSLLLFTSISQMGSVMVQEKEQRALEMVITSMNARQLVIGKVLGVTLTSLTQAAIWGLAAAIAIALVLTGTGYTGPVNLRWGALLWMIVLGVPAYFLYAVLASGLGIIAGNSQQAQQLAGILGLLGLAPLWLVGILLNDPNGSVAVVLTLFPFTAPVFALFRMAFTTIPLWQLAVSLAIIVASLLLSIWVVARIFRAAMLIFGQALRPAQILRALSQS